VDDGPNWVTNTYQVTLTNNGLAKTLTYDLNGNLTEDATPALTNKYEWDAADRLVKISRRPAGGQWNVTQFSYDGLGRRVRLSETTNNGIATKTFVWCGTELCEDRNSTGGTVSRRFFAQGEQISGTEYVFTQDHLGSIREMINSGGTIQARYEYDPYGRRTKISASTESDFAYTGHYFHQKSGLHLAQFRALDADTARWISRDPFEESDGVNLYAYVSSDPINGIDPLGLENVDKRLPDGWRANVQRPPGGRVYEIHVYNRQGGEVGVLNQDGWIRKHQKAAVPTLPRKIAVALNGLNIQEARGSGYLLERGFQNVKHMLGRLARFGGRYGGPVAIAAGVLFNSQAQAAAIIETVKSIRQDCRTGRDDWAYVGLLTYRHEINQMTGFMGSAAMRQMSREMEKCRCQN